MKALIYATICILLLFACNSNNSSTSSQNQSSISEFTILSGSENKDLEDLFNQFGKDNNVSIKVRYVGSVNMMQELANPTSPFDAVWSASSLWLTLGDTRHKLKSSKSIMTSPVVLGIKKSVASQLGFIGKKVVLKDIIDVVKAGKLHFMMTSATQSNSGASFYLGCLYALIGNPDMISKEDLNNPKLREDITSLLSGVNRTSGSSGWLKDFFIANYDIYDAMVNYESMIIEANKSLQQQNREPLYVIYLQDATNISDSPLAFYQNSNSDKEDFFNKLQNWLLTSDVQKTIADRGRRTGISGTTNQYDPLVFNIDWGIDVERILSSLRIPSSEVVKDALSLYQSEFRRPSFTVYCLDFSGSMNDNGGADELKNAMFQLFDPVKSKENLMQIGSRDVNIIIPFSDRVLSKWQLVGNKPDELNNLITKIRNFNPGGGTAVYSAIIEGVNSIQQSSPDLKERSNFSIVLMTDGKSNTGKTFADLEYLWKNISMDIPVFSITFGDASEEQLNNIATLSKARIFDGKQDGLIAAFKILRGYN